MVGFHAWLEAVIVSYVYMSGEGFAYRLASPIHVSYRTAMVSHVWPGSTRCQLLQ